MPRAPKFEVFDTNGWFYWRLRASNGRIMLDGSEPFASRSNARRAIKRLQRMLGEMVVPIVDL